MPLFGSNEPSIIIRVGSSSVIFTLPVTAAFFHSTTALSPTTFPSPTPQSSQTINRQLIFIWTSRPLCFISAVATKVKFGSALSGRQTPSKLVTCGAELLLVFPPPPPELQPL